MTMTPSLGMRYTAAPQFRAGQRVAVRPAPMTAQENVAPKAGDVQFGMSRRGAFTLIGGVAVALAALTGCTSNGATVPTSQGEAPQTVSYDTSTGQYTIGGKLAYGVPDGSPNPCPKGLDEKKTLVVDWNGDGDPGRPKTFCMAPDAPQPPSN